jgi:hypothetical protein
MPAIRHTVNHKQLLHSDKGLWTAEASDLRLGPGEWPDEIDVIFESSTKRYCHPVPHFRGVREDRELMYVEYWAADMGSRLRVYND